MFSLNMLDSSVWVTFTLWIFLLEASFMLKSWGWVGAVVVVAHEILVTAQSPNSYFPFIWLLIHFIELYIATKHVFQLQKMRSSYTPWIVQEIELPDHITRLALLIWHLSLFPSHPLFDFGLGLGLGLDNLLNTVCISLLICLFQLWPGCHSKCYLHDGVGLSLFIRWPKNE